MIKIDKVKVDGFEAAIRGMRNPMNSWGKSDSRIEEVYGLGYEFIIGKNDLDLIHRLNNGGSVNAKYRRFIIVTADITAPLYWWKEFDTYKVGTVANSCSTMHKIQEKYFTADDFSIEHLNDVSIRSMKRVIWNLNEARSTFLLSKNKEDWWQMIQLLPSSYNQKRTVLMNYEMLSSVMTWRQNHKLDEWVNFCSWVKTLPYANEIILNGGEHNEP